MEEKFAGEYAKSDRSGCKLCKTNIGIGSLRMAIFVQSPFFDGKIPNWYHFNCFFKKVLPSDTCEIKGYDGLRWQDQQKIMDKIQKLDTKSDESESSASDNRIKLKLEDADASVVEIEEEEESDEEKAEVDQFCVEYAKSNRSKCIKCSKRIEKNEIRLNKDNNGWYHLACFTDAKKELGFDFKPDDIEGFEYLEEKDQKVVRKAIGKPAKAASKRKVKYDDDDDDEDDKNAGVKKSRDDQADKESKLKSQSEHFWKLRDSLNKEISNDDLKRLIEDNHQFAPVTGRDELLNFVCDMMCFGPLEKCDECRRGQLLLKGMAYNCTGNLTEWTKCLFKTQTPIRKNWLIISKEMKKEYACLKKFAFKPQERVFSKSLEEMETLAKARSEEASVAAEKKSLLPLHRIKFAACDKLSRKKNEIKLLIERLGGKLSSQVDGLTVAIITNQVEVEKMNKKMREAKEADVHAVDEKLLDELDASGKLDVEALVLKHNIGSWGSDLKKRMADCVANLAAVESEGGEIRFTKSMGDGSGKLKLRVKGGAAVDPDSGLEEEAHVLIEEGSNEPYSSVLGLVDVMRGTNSYYKLQILESDKKNEWFVFRAWGRVGTSVGGNKLQEHSTKKDAIDDFKVIYLDKTGNSWEERKFGQKNRNKFYPLEIDYGDDENESVKRKLNDPSLVSHSKLAKPIQNLIKLMFDIENMKRQMLEFEIDLNKMPLGKISSNQIKMAFNILNELTNLMDRKGSKTMILDATNRFYTLIPHDFGMKSPTMLDHPKIIKEKTEMLNNLLEIEIAYNIIKTDLGGEEDPVDEHYKKLKCEMEVVEKESEEFARLVDYVKNTHAATHSAYQLDVQDIFKTRRDGEADRYKAFKDLHNRKLLWHGSRLTNFVGILSQGLRIAPPEAPCTGYMFGKGIYFADMVSKSANYCFTSSSNPTGLLLLCEVALGDMYERTSAEYVTKLPAGKHSTKGCGRTAPDPAGSFVGPDGVELPMGNGVDSKVKNSTLLYNEYIVYDVAQVNVKYLLRVDFKYNY